MNFARKSWATCWSILRQESAGLKANPTCVAEGFGTERTGSPLWGLLDPTMAAPVGGRLRTATGFRVQSFLVLLRRRLYGRVKRFHVLTRVGVDEPRRGKGRRRGRRRRGGWFRKRRRTHRPNPTACSRSFASSLGWKWSLQARLYLQRRFRFRGVFRLVLGLLC